MYQSVDNRTLLGDGQNFQFIPNNQPEGVSKQIDNHSISNSNKNYKPPTMEIPQQQDFSGNESILHGMEDYTHQLHATTKPIGRNLANKELEQSVGEYVEMSASVWQEDQEKTLIEDIYKNMNYSLDEFLTDPAIVSKSSTENGAHQSKNPTVPHNQIHHATSIVNNQKQYLQYAQSSLKHQNKERNPQCNQNQQTKQSNYQQI